MIMTLIFVLWRLILFVLFGQLKKKKCVLYVANNIPIFLVSAFGQYQSDVGTVYILATSGSRLS